MKTIIIFNFGMDRCEQALAKSTLCSVFNFVQPTKKFIFKRVEAFLSPAKQCLIKIPGNVLHLIAVYGKILHCKLSVTGALSRKKQRKKLMFFFLYLFSVSKVLPPV